jgi:hypothetical protein
VLFNNAFPPAQGDLFAALELTNSVSQMQMMNFPFDALGASTTSLVNCGPIQAGSSEYVDDLRICAIVLIGVARTCGTMSELRDRVAELNGKVPVSISSVPSAARRRGTVEDELNSCPGAGDEPGRW